MGRRTALATLPLSKILDHPDELFAAGFVAVACRGGQCRGGHALPQPPIRDDAREGVRYRLRVAFGNDQPLDAIANDRSTRQRRRDRQAVGQRLVYRRGGAFRERGQTKHVRPREFIGHALAVEHAEKD